MSPQSAPEQPDGQQSQCDCDSYEPSHVTGSTFCAPVEWSAQYEVIAVIGEPLSRPMRVRGAA